MSAKHCYLCASDEGVLLDLFGVGGKILRENIQYCLSVKIEEQSDAPATKICHKCAVEVDSCRKFLLKCKRRQSFGQSQLCNLCGAKGQKVHLLDIKEGISLDKLLQKICEIFGKDLFQSIPDSLCICLECRYNVDVLFDLKTVWQTTPERFESLNKKGLKLSNLPKTITRLVTRKTTVVPFPDSRSRDESEEKNGVMSKRPKRSLKPRNEKSTQQVFRTCEECNISVESGIDMYRYHRTGATVCRNCWLAIDPEKLLNRKRKQLGKAGDSTKLCAVFLQDVLSSPSKHNGVYRMEKDECGNTTFLVTDESSENDEKTVPSKRTRRASTSSSRLAPTEPAKRVLHSAGHKSAGEEPAKKNQKFVIDEKPLTTRLRTKNGIDEKAIISTQQKRNFVEPVVKPEVKRETRKQSQMDAKPSAKEGPKKLLSPGKSQKKVKSLSADEKSRGGDSSAEEVNFGRSMRIRKPVEKTIATVEKIEKKEKILRRKRSVSFTNPDSRTASNRVESSPEESLSQGPKTRISKRKFPKIAKSDSEIEKPYTCTICGSNYKNILAGKAHELTHERQPEVLLERIVIPKVAKSEIPDSETAEQTENGEEKRDEKLSEDENHKSEEATNRTTEETESPDLDGKLALEPEEEKAEKSVKDGENDECNEPQNMKNVSVEDVQDAESRENDDNENKENDDNENKENDEYENKENDDSEDKENDDNENKENDDKENKENGEKSVLGTMDIQDIGQSSSEQGPEERKTEEKVEENDEERSRIEIDEDAESSCTEKTNNEAEVEKPEVDAKEPEEPETSESNTNEPEVDDKEDHEPEVDAEEVDEPEVKQTEVDEPKVNEMEVDKPKVEVAEADDSEMKNVDADKSEFNGVENDDAEVEETSSDNVKVEESKIAEPEVNEREVESKFGNSVETEENAVTSSVADEDTIENDEFECSRTETIKPIEESEKIEELEESKDSEDDESENTDEETVEKSNEKKFEEEKSEKNCRIDEESSDEKKRENGNSSDEESQMQSSESLDNVPDSTKTENSTSVENAVSPKKVFDLACAEVKKRLEKDTDQDKDKTAETLENISLEIQNSGLHGV